MNPESRSLVQHGALERGIKKVIGIKLGQVDLDHGPAPLAYQYGFLVPDSVGDLDLHQKRNRVGVVIFEHYVRAHAVQPRFFLGMRVLPLAVRAFQNVLMPLTI
ncbi:hypothetical protein CMZ82_09580 [Lysobacteraceae bacterium NML93-0792]|nr:hypothetical protein CMZ82_09580 [Xanthomonadaceae bacterium NML93-0792]PBS15945.1 hypothetical protein CMZ81_08400 [Xanthomonadaceae bacterium NML93-0793]PBS18874.1 hypothetical protein CMZ80_09195 [Xanthomonadaceae bacterium NML93-0831]